MHTAGWPMESDTYGGAFLYHLEGNKVTLGFVTGLDYTNPYLSPFEEFQRWKTHPNIRYYLRTRRAKSPPSACPTARAPSTPAASSLPKTVFPGGALVGCDAGYLNVSRIKGSHAAIKTGMLAAEAAYDAVGPPARRTQRLPQGLRGKLAHTELNKTATSRTGSST
jgi:electron-transferring-flavoprotein dehydrogenase